MKIEKITLEENYSKSFILSDEYGYLHLAGAIKIYINNLKTTISSNSYIILHPYDNIKITALTEANITVYRIRDKSLKEILNVEPEIKKLFEIDKNDLSSRIYLAHSYSELMQESFTNRLYFIENNEIKVKYLLSLAYTALLLCNVYNDISSNILKERKPRLSLDYIDDYFISKISDSNLDLTMIATHFDISVTYLASFYKEKSGKNLSKVIRDYRLELAIRYLKEGARVIDVYSKVGFSSYNNFFKQFKKVYGMPPLDYIKITKPNN